MNKHDLRNLSRIKNYVVELRSKRQIPLMLAYYVLQLNENSSQVWIIYLKRQCEEMMRVSGYYKRYPDIDKEMNNTLKSDYQKFLEKGVI